MSGEIIFRIGWLHIGDAICIGCPKWRIKFWNPHRAYGMFLEINTPGHDFEIRWMRPRERPIWCATHQHFSCECWWRKLPKPLQRPIATRIYRRHSRAVK